MFSPEKVMSEETWIASYPRSGSTWMRYIVSILVYGNDSLTEIDSFVADAQNGNMPKKYRYAKTNRCVPIKGCKVIYVIRHPVDVCASAYRYEQLKGNNGNADDFVFKFITGGYNSFGPWDDHVNYWMASDNDVVSVKYEDMCRGARPSIKGVAKHIGHEKNIEKAVDMTTLERMQKEENDAIQKKEESNFYDESRNKQYKRGLRFISVGKYGYANRTLSEQNILDICKKFKSTLVRYNYAPVYQLRSE